MSSSAWMLPQPRSPTVIFWWPTATGTSSPAPPRSRDNTNQDREGGSSHRPGHRQRRVSTRWVKGPLMRHRVKIEDIEEMRQRQGIDDAELREAIRGLEVGDLVRLTLLTG